MLNIYSDRERTKPCDLSYQGTHTGEYYIVNKDSSNPEKVRVDGDSKLYAYGEGVHIEAYGNSCVTLFDGAVATLNDESMLMLVVILCFIRFLNGWHPLYGGILGLKNLKVLYMLHFVEVMSLRYFIMTV
mgnify:CR=1 FL=1